MGLRNGTAAWRRTAGLICVLCASVALLGCQGGGFSEGGTTADAGGGETAGTQAQGEDVTLRLLVNITPNLTDEFWNDLVAGFEERNPGVDVVVEGPTGEDVGSTLQQQLAAGTAPDVVSGMHVDADVAPQMATLTGEPWIEGVPGAEDARLAGEVYELGVGYQIQSLIFYNEEAFAEAGITAPPATLDELTEAMRAVQEAGYLPLQTAGEWVTGAQVLMMANPMVMADNPDWYVDRTAGDVQFQGSEYQRVLEVYDSWIENGYVDPNALGVQYADAEAQFLAGDAAMYLMGSWFVPAADEAAPDFEIGVFPTPTLDGSTPPQAGNIAAPYMVLESTENRDLAVDLVEYLTTDEDAVAAQLAADGNYRSGYSYEASPLGEEVGEILEAAPGTVPVGTGVGDNAAPPGFTDEFNELVQGLYLDATPADVVGSIDGWWDENAQR